jgi:HEPN domain-containing protein
VIEKSLKAWLAALNVDYPFIHDLSRLLERLLKLSQDIKPYQTLATYSIYAIHTQYGDTPKAAEDTPLDRAQALADARGVYEHVRDLISRMRGDA